MGKVFDGAKGDGITLNSHAIAAAFADCRDHNGGTVLFPGSSSSNSTAALPQPRYLTGPWAIACN